MTARGSGRAWLIALALCGAATATTSTAAAQSANEAAAQVRFQRGRELFVANDFNGALTEFRAANQLVGSPNTRLYIARCLRGLGRLGEAYIEFQRAGAEAADRAVNEPRYAASRDAARQEMDAIRPQIGNLTIHAPHAPEGLEVRVAGTVIPTAMMDVAMPTTPGSVEVTATAPGRLPFRQEATVRASATTELSVEMRVDPNYVPPTNNSNNANTNSNTSTNNQTGGNETPPTPRLVRVSEGGGARIGGFVVAAVGLGGLGAFIGFGTMANSRFASLQGVCGTNGPCPDTAAHRANIDEGEMFQTAANVGLIAGGVALVAGTVMIIVGGPKERFVPESELRPQARRRVSPQWAPVIAPSAGGASAGVVGTF
ncbi:MAG: hypothetical protein U0269_21475 [Polyangiales bacterium]